MISRVAPLVHVDTGLLARQRGEAAAETTDGSQGEGNLRRCQNLQKHCTHGENANNRNKTTECKCEHTLTLRLPSTLVDMIRKMCVKESASRTRDMLRRGAAAWVATDLVLS